MSGSNAEVGDSVVGAGKLQREPEPWWVGKTGPAHTEGTSLYSMNDMAKVQGQRRACLSGEHHLTSGCLGGRKRREDEADVKAKCIECERRARRCCFM